MTDEELKAIEAQVQRAADLATAMGFKGDPAATATLVLVAEVRSLDEAVQAVTG